MTTSLNPQQMSPLTRNLFDYEQGFQKEAAKDPSVIGKVKATLVGRVFIRLGMSLILHAEGVARAVYICFLSIKHCFSRSDQELIKIQKEQCYTAFALSFRSFFSIFYRSLLDRVTLELPPAPQPLPVSIPAHISTVSIPPIASVVSSEPVVIAQPVSSQPHSQPMPMPIQEPQHNASQAQQPEPVVQPLPENRVEEPRPVQAPPSEPALSPRNLEVGNINEPPRDDQELHQEINDDMANLSDGGFNDSISIIPSEFDYSIVPSERNSRPHSPGSVKNLLVRSSVQDQKEQKTALTVHEQARLKEALRLEKQREAAFKEEKRELTANQVMMSLINEMTFTGLNVNFPPTQLELKTGPEQHYDDPKWKISRNNDLGMEIGICQYAENREELSAQYLITQFNLNIGGTDYPVRLLGLFDPLIGSRASDYLSQNLPTVLTEKLKEKNKIKLSDEGIYNALTDTFLELNRVFIKENKNKRADVSFREFIADQGSTATVVMILDDRLWTAHVGNSRAALDNGAQLNRDQNPEAHKPKIQNLGGTVIDGKVNGKLNMATVVGCNDLHGAASSRPGIVLMRLNQIAENSHLILGTNGIFDVASTRVVANWLHDHPSNVKSMAHDVVYSIFEENQRTLKNKPLTCLIAKINPTKINATNNHENENKNNSNISDNNSNASYTNNINNNNSYSIIDDWNA